MFTSLTPGTHDLCLAYNISRAKTEFQHNICFLPVMYISHPQMNMLDAIHEASEFPDPFMCVSNISRGLAAAIMRDLLTSKIQSAMCDVP